MKRGDGWVRVVPPSWLARLPLELSVNGVTAPFGARVPVACPEAQICVSVRHSDRASVVCGEVRVIAPVAPGRETFVGFAS